MVGLAADHVETTFVYLRPERVAVDPQFVPSTKVTGDPGIERGLERQDQGVDAEVGGGVGGNLAAPPGQGVRCKREADMATSLVSRWPPSRWVGALDSTTRFPGGASAEQFAARGQ